MWLFMPYAFEKQMRIAGNGGRFVHYTTAEVAMSILREKEVWMRNATTMNDYLEIDYGMECLNTAYKSDAGKRFQSLLDGVLPGVVKELEDLFNGWLPQFRSDTYLTSVSEHRESENEIGRLSMWRAYGGQNGVAIVMNNHPFLTPSDALRAYSSPVAYMSEPEFARHFETIAENLEANRHYVTTMTKATVVATVFYMFRFAVLCTKHPGFVEEAEWRVVHSPSFEPSGRLIRDLKVIRGTPQHVIKIPLRNVPDEGFTGAEIPELVDRIIIGPTQYPGVMFDAFVALLREAGGTDAESRVFISHIPLRE